jgi:hypothetical protein
MKLQLDKITLFSALLLLFVSCGGNKETAKSDEIDWKKISLGYYVGVGTASFSKDAQTTRAIAHEAALADLAKKISVTISDEIVINKKEKDGIYQESFEQMIKSTLKNTELTGIETYRIQEDPVTNDLTIILRINQGFYEAWLEEKSQENRKMAIRYWESGNRERGRQNAGLSLAEYMKAFQYLMNVRPDSWAYEDLFTGAKTDLFDDIRTKISAMLEDIEIATSEGKGSLVAGTWEKQHFDVELKYKDQPLDNFPLAVSFPGAKNRYRSDKDGKLQIILNGVQLEPGDLILCLTPDLEDFVDPQLAVKAPIDLYAQFRPPVKDINLTVRPVKVWMKAREESDFGILQAHEQFVGQTLKRILTDKLHWVFVDYQYQSDLTLELHCKASQTQQNRMESGYLYTYRTNVRVSLKNSKTGEEFLSWIQDPPSKSGGQNQKVAVQNSLRVAKADMENRFGDEIVQLFKESKFK